MTAMVLEVNKRKGGSRTAPTKSLFIVTNS